MSKKEKLADSHLDPVRSRVAAMKFWSRFTQPQPTHSFAFPEPVDWSDDEPGFLSQLPSVPYDDSIVYSLRITIADSKPRIWRRLTTKSVSLEILHSIIQLLMGWNDSHLHGYEIRKRRVPLPDDGADVDEQSISIAQLFAAKIKRLSYTYDFGDNWRLTISIEESMPTVKDVSYPQCVAGQGAPPLEDIGGIQIWSKLLSAIRYPQREQCDETRALMMRLGDEFVLSEFDLPQTNTRLQRIFHRQSRGRKKK
ncbi:plasmid pRiA4b ORF-3 family protein [Schlesneria paludicola]|uniref:plasmid pRiA4b ORF-3 family protein n=1 Tax=Schlesneria paludicola TaxID=360056 RepID=UPI0012FA489F|nr:plasmid pRiA4b ORF-3 family protein [Schlesneria paludicola]